MYINLFIYFFLIEHFPLPHLGVLGPTLADLDTGLHNIIVSLMSAKMHTNLANGFKRIIVNIIKYLG